MKKPVILLIDDDPENLQLLGNTLKSLDCELAYANDPKYVLEQINHILPDLILMDIVMPAIDGYKLSMQIKDLYSDKNIPIIFLTALKDKDSLSKAYDAGGIDYVTKPYDMSELKARIATHLRIKEGHQKLIEELDDNSTTIDILIKKFNNDIDKLKKDIHSQIETTVKPYLHSLQKSLTKKKQKQLLGTVLLNIDSITKPLLGDMSVLAVLTPSELRIANLLKIGKVNKEISELLCISLATVAFHRKNIRDKLNLKNKKISLKDYLNKINI